MPLLGMEGLLEQMKDHARIHIDKNIKNKQKIINSRDFD